MQEIRIAAAQSTSFAGDLERNVQMHCHFVQAAAQHGVDVLVFPELSLCGYELLQLDRCLVHAQSVELAPLQEIVGRTGVTAVVGAPVASGHGRPFIAALTLNPQAAVDVYCKQHLHAGEEVYACPGLAADQRTRVNAQGYALAVCADISHAEHAQAAADAGAPLYLSSVLVSDAGYAKDAGHLQHYAAKHHMGVLMANHAGPTGSYVSAGKSAFWMPGGQLLVQTSGPGNCLVIASKTAGRWSGSVLPLTVPTC